MCMQYLVMANEKRTCLACGRPLTGRKKKWCGHPDCGGWESLHPRITITCSCGQAFETYRDSGVELCFSCKQTKGIPENPITKRVCIQCGAEYELPKSQGYLWCCGDCYHRYFRQNPQPEYYEEYKILKEQGLCYVCKSPVSEGQEERGVCSPECEGIFRVRDRIRIGMIRQRIQRENDVLAAKLFDYVYGKQWLEVSGALPLDEEYIERYKRGYADERKRVKLRELLDLSYDAEISLDEKTIPTTTELPIQQWLEENKIEFEDQYYIEIGDTWTLVDFFIPLPDAVHGICFYCDGDYWHGPDFPETLEKDAMQVRELCALGHVVIRLRESEIQEGVRPTQVLDLLKVVD